MKKIILLLALVVSLSTTAWQLDGKDYYFKKIAKDVYIMHGPLAEPSKENEGFMNNPGFIIANKGLIVIDPGSSYHVGKQVIKEIEKISKKPIIAALNSHIHGDHWLANQAIIEKYPNAKIYAHPKMIKQANGEEGLGWIDIMHQLTSDFSKNTKIVAPTIATKHHQIIKIDGQEFKIHNPLERVHTNTDIMVEHINSKTLFLGDNSFSKRMGRFDASSSMHGNIKVLQYAKKLDIKSFVPGHGLTGSSKTAIEPFLNYIKLMKKTVAKGYEEDLQDYEIRPMIIAVMHEYEKWPGFEENLGTQINKMYLEVEALD